MLNDLNRAYETLLGGGIILYPTDTIWGIGCDASREKSVGMIYQIKKRHDSKAMLILVNSESMLKDYVVKVPDVADALLNAAEKPLTIIYPRARNLPGNLINRDGSIGIRVTRDPFCQQLIGRLGKPLVSTSANISGDPYPANYDEISEKILKQVDYIVQHRREDHLKNRPSALIRVRENNRIDVIRK